MMTHYSLAVVLLVASMGPFRVSGEFVSYSALFFSMQCGVERAPLPPPRAPWRGRFVSPSQDGVDIHPFNYARDR